MSDHTSHEPQTESPKDLLQHFEINAAMKEAMKSIAASQLTEASIKIEAAALGASPDVGHVEDMLSRIAAAPRNMRRKLFAAAKEVLDSPESRAVMERGWKQLVGDQYVFDDVDELIDAINERCAVVPQGNEIRFVFIGKDGVPLFRKRHDASLALAQYQLVSAPTNGGNGKVTYSPGFPIWLGSSRRREFSRIVFNPNPNAVASDEFNMWCGLAVSPSPGDWSLLRSHIFENICQYDQVKYDFLIAVLAQLFQFPWKKAGVSLVFRGKLGVGKTKLMEWVKNIVGQRHTVVIDKAEQLVGRFTGQLEYALLAMVEEGFFAGDPKTKGALKNLVTGKSILMEKKGVDAFDVPNFTRVFITSNEDWVIPAAVRERRYLFLDVGDAHIQDGPYFAAIDEQMENGGAEAMLYDLLRHDISGVDFSKVPLTSGLQHQIQLGFSAPESWLEAVLTDGSFPFKDPSYHLAPEWEADGCLEIAKDLVVESFQQFVPVFRSSATPQQVGTFLNSQIPGLKEIRRRVGVERKRFWVFPALSTLRTAFIEARPGYEFAAEAEELHLPTPTPVHQVGEAGIVLPFPRSIAG